MNQKYLLQEIPLSMRWKQPFKRIIIMMYLTGWEKIRCFSSQFTAGKIWETRYDENGNDNFYGGGGSSGGFVSHHHDRLEEFPRASQLLIIDYDYNGRKFYAEIPLTEEGGSLLLAD